MAGQKRTDNKGRILKDNETQRKDGTYRFTYTDADGKRHDVYSRRLVPTDRLPPGCKDDLSLREKERKILRDLEDGIKATVENKATLNDLFNLYISNKPELKQSTRATISICTRSMSKTILARRKSQALSIQMSRLTITASSESVDLSPIPWKSFTPSIHPVFTMAVRDGYIRINPATGAMAEIKKSNNWEKPKRHALTKAEQAAFIDYIKSSKIYNHWLPLFTVLLGTGCRIGEVIGLRWEDCDFEDGIISINHNMVYRKYEGESKARFHIETPKTEAGTRIVPMLEEVKEALRTEVGKQES